MFLRATLSILGLYNYDPTLFDDMPIPDGVDRETLVPLLLDETADLEVVTPNPGLFKTLLTRWASTRLPVWQRLYDTTQYEYNAIDNYDRIEEWTEEIQHNGNEKANEKATGAADATNSSNGTTQHDVFGFNEETAAHESRDTSNASASSHASNEYARDTNRDSDDHTTHTHKAHMRGNIGTTTTQAMIEAQRDVVQFDIYAYIIDDIKRRFCLLVY